MTGFGSLPKGSEHILLVEDDENVRSTIEGLLVKLGYRVGAVSNAQDALAGFEQGEPTPDLLITDIVLPDLSGLELSRRLREQRPKLRTLFISGHSREERDPRGEMGPTDSFLKKPFNVQVLAGLVRTLLDEKLG
jgi:DNA-binding response OmpR family regulator